jgi:hypothetical protein
MMDHVPVWILATAPIIHRLALSQAASAAAARVKEIETDEANA